jgi:glutamine synthetase adenylyltransferase
VFRSKRINPAQPEWESAWTKARRHYEKAQGLERSKRFAEKIVKYVWRYYPDREFISKVLLIENRSLLK